VENRSGLLLDFVVAPTDGYAERREAAALLAKLPGTSRKTVGADKGYDTTGFVAECRELGVTPHVAENAHRLKRSAIDARTTRHAGYEISQIVRRRIEGIFGLMEVFGGLHGPGSVERPTLNCKHAWLLPPTTSFASGD
jgi:hypothetical protein